MYDTTDFFFDVLRQDFCIQKEDGTYEMDDPAAMIDHEDFSGKTPATNENSEQPSDHRAGSFSSEPQITVSQEKKQLREQKEKVEVQKKLGRWTPDEHQKFLEALKIYGKDWEEIEKYVGTREISNIRSHAQKFLAKLIKFIERKKLIKNMT